MAGTNLEADFADLPPAQVRAQVALFAVSLLPLNGAGSDDPIGVVPLDSLTSRRCAFGGSANRIGVSSFSP